MLDICMERKVFDKNILDKFTEEFAKIVERHCKYIIVSGFVAIAHGRTRGTEDIDMIIERISKLTFTNLHLDLVKAGFECMQSDNAETLYEDYLTKNISIRYVKNGQILPELEMKLAKDGLDEMQIKTRKKLPLTGLDVYFSSIEMNIAFKEELLKSQKDMEDAKHLRIIYEGKIDKVLIEKIKEMIKELRLR
jgi:predicted nucleic acid-binding protein